MLEQVLLRYGYVLVFGGTAIEGDAVLLTAAFLAHRGYFQLPWVIVTAALANTVADFLYYGLARRSGREAFDRRAATDAKFARVGAWVRRRGAMLLFAARFVWGFRIAIPAACGAAGMRRRTFVVVDLAGSLVWAIAFGVAGYALGNSLDVVLADVRRVEWYVVAALLGGAVLAAIAHRKEIGRELTLLRRPAQAVIELSGLLFTFAHRAGRTLVLYPEARAAAAVVGLGALSLVSALFHWHFVRLDAIEAALPLEVTHGSRALMMLNGVALVTMGRGLARRKRAVWGLAVIATATSAVLYVGHGAHLVRALLSVSLLLELLRHRRHFAARSDPVRFRHALLAAPVLAAAFTVFGAVGIHELTGVAPAEAGRRAWQVAVLQEPGIVPPKPSDRAFVDSLRLLALASAAYLALALLAPVALGGEPTASVERVRELAWDHGVDSLSYFAKQPDKRHVLVDDVFFGFRVVHRVAIVAGDPVGPPGNIPAAIARFVERCRINDWIPVFYEVSARYLDAYRACRLQSFKVAEEAVIPLSSFTLQGGRMANLRHTITKTRKEAPDLAVVEYERTGRDPEMDQQLEEVSDEWLAGKRGSEMGFNLGVFSVEDLADKRTMVAVSGTGRVHAFVTWLPYRAGRALVLDGMRRRNDAPYGVMDVLIAESALAFKKEGVEAISLATAPLANIDESGQSPYDRGVKLIFEHFSSLYGYRSLFNYKKKFNPAWEGRYLVFPRADLLPRIAYALVAVHTEGGVWKLLLNRD